MQYISGLSQYESFDLLLNLLGTLLVSAGLVFTALEVRKGSRAQSDSTTWQRQMAAQEAISNSHEREIKSEIEKKLRFIDSPRIIPLAEILAAKDPRNDPDGKFIPGLHRVLNTYEALARGVRLGLYDESVIRAAREIPMTTTYHAFQEYIEHRTSVRGTNPWSEYHAIVKKWLGDHS